MAVRLTRRIIHRQDLVDQVRGVDQMDALGFSEGEKFAEGTKCLRVRMADGDGLSFLASILGRQLQLAANCADLPNIIEEGNVAKRARNLRGLGYVVGDGGGGGTAVDEKEMVIAEKRHEFGHESRVRGGERALMIVDTGDVRHIDQHGVQHRGNFRGRHAGAKLPGLRSLIGEGFHGEMEHDLVAAAMRFPGNLRGTKMIGKDGKSQRIVQGENGIDGGGITGNIVKNDGQARTCSDGMGRARRRAGSGRAVRMEQRLDRRLDPAAATERNRERCERKAEDESRGSPGSKGREIHERD